jgi:choice-of-anchor B domain-containing protein
MGLPSFPGAVPGVTTISGLRPLPGLDGAASEDELIPRSLRALVLAALTLAIASGVASAQTLRNIQLLDQWNEYPQTGGNTNNAYSSCWSYIHQDGREYAVIGTYNGTAIYNVTDPVNSYRVGFIPGRSSVWREMKSYRNWIYVVTEAWGTAGIAPGIQIIRMTDPEAPVLVATYAPPSFQTSHTVSIDTTRALLICNGTRYWQVCSPTVCGYAAGMRILSLANPEAPVEVGWWPGGTLPVAQINYVHDSVPIGNRLYASSIYYGIQRVLDFTTPSAPTQISAWTYPGGFSHNAWPDATGNVLYVTDEVNGQPLKIFDITNPAAPTMANRITSNPQAIVHNAHVKGNELYLANYTEGIRILDITDPLHPAEFAWADSWPGVSGYFNGVWEVCPYFPSGTVIASDRTTGLYVYRPIRSNHGVLRVKVVSQATGTPVAGAMVTLTSQGDSLTTTDDGIVQFAPNAGAHTVVVKKFHYQGAPIGTTVTAGGRDTFTVAIPALDLAGTLRETGTLDPLVEAEVEIDHHPAIGFTNAAGQYVVPGIPEDHYMVHVRAPGHIPLTLHTDLAASDPTADFVLMPAASWDAMETASGWTTSRTPGLAIQAGQWTRTEPMGTGAVSPGLGLRTLPGRSDSRGAASSIEASLPGARVEHDDHDREVVQEGGAVQPEYDRTPAPGNTCWVTGQGIDPLDTNQADVDSGAVTLTSPTFDVSSMTEPMVAYWRWFYGNTPPFDWLATQISNDNGASWTTVDTTRGIQNSWEEATIRVEDYVVPTAQMKVRFIAADWDVNSLVEAAIDDFAYYDAATPQTGAPMSGTPGRLAWRAPWPNPARGLVRLALELPRRGAVDVDVIDLAGRRVRALHRGSANAGLLVLRWEGLDEAGQRSPAGVYFVRARLEGKSVETRLVWVR